MKTPTNPPDSKNTGKSPNPILAPEGSDSQSNPKTKNSLEMSQNPPAIKVNGLIKIYKRNGVETSALRGLAAEFHAGEIAIIMGPSGCGKTTLMNILSGVSRPNAGNVTVFGKDLTSFSEDELEDYRRDQVSYIFQQLNLIPSLNIWDNIVFALEYTNRLEDTECRRVEDIIALIGLEPHLKKYPYELSGGEQQRVALAAALAKNSKIILCDEPTGELDSASKLTVMELLSQIHKSYPEKIIIVVTHDSDFKIIADRLLYIRDGRISYELSPQKLQSLKSTEVELNFEESPDSGGIHADDDEDLVTELREIETIVHQKLEFYENRQKQRTNFHKKRQNL